MTHVRRLLGLACFLALTGLGWADPPLNDDYEHRLPLDGDDIFQPPVSNAEATAELARGEPRHAGQDPQHSVWWVWTPPTDGYAVLDTTNSTFASRVAIYENKKKLNELEGSSPSRLNLSGIPSTADHYEFAARKESKYDIVVDGLNGATGDVDLHLKLYTTPEITVQPQDLTVIEGQPANFSVRAIGLLPLTYQWQFRDPNNGGPFTDIPGATGRDFEIRAARPANEGWYRVVVRNSAGFAVSDPPVYVYVEVRPKVQPQPAPASVFVGETATFRSGAIGGQPMFFQWQFKPTAHPAWDWSDLPGATDATLTLDNVSTDEAGQYRMRAINDAGEDVSTNVTLTVTIRGPSIPIQPKSLTRIVGEDAVFSTLGRGYEPIGYQWYFRPRTGGTARALPGGVDPDLYLYSVTLADDGFYWAVISNRYGVTNTVEATLTVETRPPNDNFEKGSESEFALLPPAGWTESFLVRSNGWNRNGTGQPGEPRHEGQTPLHSVWWNFTAPDDGMVLVSASAPFSTVLGVYTGTAVDQLSAVVTTNNGATKTFLADKATKYLFAVDGANGQFGSNIVLTLNFNTKLDAPIFIVEPFDFFGFFGGFFGGDGDGGCQNLTFTTLAISLDGFVRYQWQYRPSPEAEFSDIVGQTGTTLTLRNVTADMAGQYRVIAYNKQGTSTIGRVAVLTVNVGPAIPENGHPTNIVAEACMTVTNRVIAQGCGDLRYQWRHDGVPVPGQTDREIILRELKPFDAGFYDVIVSNRNAGVTSRVAQLTVITNPVITKQPLPVRTTDCGEARFEVQARAVCPLRYQWRLGRVPYEGATSNIWILPRPSPLDEGLVDVIVSTEWGEVISDPVSLTVDAGPSITRLTFNTKEVKAPPAQTTTVRDCAAVCLAVQPGSSCTPLHYQWRKDGKDAPGETNASLCFTASLETAGEYTVEMANDWGVILSNPIGVAVDTRPLIERQPDSERLLAGESFTNEIDVSSCSGLTYRWQYRPNQTDEFQNLVLDPRRHSVGTNGWLVVQNAKTNETGFYRVIASNAYTNVISDEARIRVLVRPPNDNFVNRIYLGRTNTVTVSGFNEMGTREDGEPDHAYQPPTHSIWYSWTAPYACLATVDLSASDFDTVVGVYTGNTVSNLVSVTFDDNGGPNRRSKVSFLAGRDRTFAFAIDGKYGAESTNVFMTVTTEPLALRPEFYEQPDNLARTNGMTAEFRVRAYGSPDITVQWLSNTIPILAATNITLIGVTNAETASVYGLTNYEARLVLTNVQPEFEANYRAVLCNEYGCVTSRIARLTFGSIVKGMVTDAIDGLGIPGATVSVGLVSTNTDEFGNYELVGVRLGELRAEFYAEKERVRLNEPVQFRDRHTATAVQFTATKDGYYKYVDDQFEVGKGQTVAKVFSMSPVFEGVRFVLNWGLEPDLDFYLSLPPTIPGLTNYTLWYPEEAHGSLGPPYYAELEYDTNKFGPETITISRVQAGTYSLYVEKFGATSGQLITSGAKVFAYFGGAQSNNLYGFVEVPKVGTNLVWHVCDIEGPWTNITWVNQLVDLPPHGQPPPPRLLSLESPRPIAGHRSVGLHSAPEVDVAFEWDFGDGTPHTATNRLQDPTHPYADPGWYDVRLTITQTNGPTGKTVTEFKQRYIQVTNTPPVIAITNPPSGWIVRGGDPILIEARAYDVDDPVARVDFFLIVGGSTNLLGGVTQPPYNYTFTAVPYADTQFTFTARATDAHNGIAWAEPVIVRVRDLQGDVLIVRNRDHPEVHSLTNMLKETVEDEAWPILLWKPFETRVLDQEGLHWDLIKGFKTIVWHDPGDPDAGTSDPSPRLTTNDVGVFYQAYQAGISLYFISERSALAAARMDYPYDTEWRLMTQLTTNSLAHFTNETIAFTNRFSQHPLLERWAGEVRDFRYPGVIEDAVSTRLGAEVVGRAVTAHPLLADPPFDQPDFGLARTVTQGFLVTNGGNSEQDRESKDARRALFVNTVMWLLRLTECSNFTPRITCFDELEEISTGEPVTFRARLSSNGRCPMNGITVTNLLPLHSRLVTSSLFVPGDLKDLPSLAKQLKQPPNELTFYLNSRWSAATRQALSAYRGVTSDPGPLERALLGDLNQIINGASIYDEARFTGVALRAETRALRDAHPLGSSLVRLNRQLIEDAYPGEVLRDRLVEAGGFALFSPGSPTSPGDFPANELPLLAKRLKDQSDPVSKYLAGRFSEWTRTALLDYLRSPADEGLKAPLMAALAEEFNQVVLGESVYESNRFAGVKLPPQTARRLANNPRDDALVHLNRLLIEAAYPESIVQTPALPPQEIGGLPDRPDAIVLRVGRVHPEQEGRIYVRLVPLQSGLATNQFTAGVNTWKSVDEEIICSQVVFVKPGSCDTPPTLSAVRLPDGRVKLVVEGTAGCRYDLQWAGRVSVPLSWATLTQLETTGTTTDVTMSVPSGAGERFYRAVVVP